MKGIFILFGLLLLTGVSCNKNDDYIPHVPVNITINPSLPAYIDLNPVGGSIYVSGGSKGIIIYRRSPDEFMAYDRHSPYEAEKGCIVNIDPSLTSASDTCSGSVFNLYDGAVTGGPSGYPLKAYNTSFEGGILRIYN